MVTTELYHCLSATHNFNRKALHLVAIIPDLNLIENLHNLGIAKLGCESLTTTIEKHFPQFFFLYIKMMEKLSREHNQQNLIINV